MARQVNPSGITPFIIAMVGQPTKGERKAGQEKLLGLINIILYRKPTQVGRCKCTKAYERNIVQELGKKVAVTSG